MSNTMSAAALVDIQNNDAQGAIREVLKTLLESGTVEAVLVPRPTPDGSGFVQTLVTEAALLESSAPLAPTLPVHTSHILTELTADLTGRIAAVVKPCELRASIELGKFLQVDLENVLTIGVDCAGTYDVVDFAALTDSDRISVVDDYTSSYASATFAGDQSIPLRKACKACRLPIPENADLRVSLYGFVSDDRVRFVASGKISEDDREAINFDWKELDGEVMEQEHAQHVVSERTSIRDAELSELRARISNGDGLTGILANCIRCHNCMNVCPICYCRECVFESSAFRRRSPQFLNLSKRKGAVRMPSDTTIFHLTRMSHMATSCVACGMCESGCPSDIPVSRLFTLIGSELQTMFEYTPGIDPATEPPVKEFKEQELQAESGSGEATGH